MVDAIAAVAPPPPRIIDLAPAMPQQTGPVEAGQFEAALKSAAAEHAGNKDVAPAIKGMFTTLDKVNGEAKSVADYARTVESKGGELTPGEMVGLTMRCQEFMFHCQLTSNIANRSSDGVQQLFRQQG